MGKIKLSERNSLHIINENPYRVLGVYANTSLKDIMANKSKTIAFMKVGKTVSFPMDMEFVMPTVTRTQESVDASISTISTNQDKIKYAQFWFLNVSRFDEVAFKNLFDGNCSTAMEIWGKVDKLSHLQNLIVCYLISKDYESALMIAQKLYGDFGDEFVKTVDSNCTLNVTGMDLWHQFIDIIGAEVGMQTLLTCVYEKKELEPTIKYIVGQLMDSITARILNEIEKSKNVNHKDSEARIQGARNLIRNIRNDLNLMKSVLGEQDSRYIMIVDKYATEILQCSIDYYNNTHGVMTAHTAMKMLNFADGIVGLSTIVKQRIAENRKILQKIIDKLPPMEVAEESMTINEAIAKYEKMPETICNAQGLLYATTIHLNTMKSKLGNEHAYYVKLSTLVAGIALHNVIEEVNRSYKSKNINNIESTLKAANYVIQNVSKLDMSSDFKDHFEKNKAILEYSLEQVKRENEIAEMLKKKQEEQVNFTFDYQHNKRKYFWGFWGIVIFIAAIYKSCEGFSQKRAPKEYDDYIESLANLNTEEETVADTVVVDTVVADTVYDYYEDDEADYNYDSDEKSTESNVVPVSPSYTVTYYDTGNSPYGRGVYDSNSLSELTIKNGTDLDAVVVLQSSNDVWIRNSYVKRYTNYTMRNIPSCNCIIKVMYGRDWYDNKDNGDGYPKGGFMKDVDFSKSKWDNSFDFTPQSDYDGISYPTYSVTLHVVRNGNFSTSKIGKREFFN